MDWLFGVISVMWVIGVVTLQRLDSTCSDYVMTVRVQFSIDVVGDKGIQLEQLQALTHFSLPGLLSFIEKSKQGPRKEAALRAESFFKWFKRLQFFYEVLLVAVTLGAMLVYAVDFSGIRSVQWFDKKWELLSVFVGVCIISLALPRLVGWISDRNRML